MTERQTGTVLLVRDALLRVADDLSEMMQHAAPAQLPDLDRCLLTVHLLVPILATLPTME